jgi:cytochrome c oxidase cbb3-type subunit IV
MTIENILSDARSILTLVSFLTFIGIAWWAYSARRADAFRSAAMLPFNDETPPRGEDGSHV